jgi:hypothetical protein
MKIMCDTQPSNILHSILLLRCERNVLRYDHETYIKTVFIFSIASIIFSFYSFNQQMHTTRNSTG